MKTNKKPKQSAGNERGVSALEFTLLAPLIFVLVFGMIEFGILFYDKQIITNASREGARAGIIAQSPRVTEGEIKGVVRAYAQKNLVTFGNDILTNDDIGVEGAGGSFGQDLKVTVQYKYNFLVFPNFKNLRWVGDDFPGEINLKATSVMKME